MNLTEAQNVVKQRLTNSRYEHTLRVAKTAEQLARKYNESVERTKLAALLHDYAKCDPEEELKRQIIQYNLPRELLNYNKELWHGPVGAKVAKEKFGILDEDVLHAIYYHTTARAKMTKLEMIIFVADYIEPGRKFPGVEEVRNLVKVDLEKAALKVLGNTIMHLVRKGITIFPDTFYAYNQLTKKWEG